MTVALVATDGSDTSLHAAERGKALFGDDTRYVALNVRVPPTTAIGDRLGDPRVYDQLEDAGRELARDALDGLVSVLGADADRREETGDAGSIICEVAEEIGADVVVVGSHGKGAIRRAVLGSTSLYVVNHAPCPVLVHRE